MRFLFTTFTKPADQTRKVVAMVQMAGMALRVWFTACAKPQLGKNGFGVGGSVGPFVTTIGKSISDKNELNE